MGDGYNQFRDASVNRAVDEIDALVFSGDPTARECDELERMCRRWLRGIGKNIHEINQPKIDTGEDLV